MKQSNQAITWLLLPLILVGCSQDEQGAGIVQEAVRVKTQRIEAVPLEKTNTFSGTVEEKNGTALSFATAGTIRTLNIHLGDRVSKGQLIGTLDDTSARNSHAAAQATLAQAEDAYHRMKELYDKGSLPEIRWVETQSKLQQARSMEAVARKQMEDCRLTAPYDGVIAEKTGETGQNVLPGFAVARLVTTTGQQVRIAVPEAEIGRIREGQQASIRVPATGGKTYTGTVVERGIRADALSRSYPVKLRVDDADSELLPGMVAEVSLWPADGETACILPLHIVQLDERNRNFVWVNREGKAEQRFITCGDFAGDGVIVTQGLQPGDIVIVKGQHKVCNGTVINEE